MNMHSYFYVKKHRLIRHGHSLIAAEFMNVHTHLWSKLGNHDPPASQCLPHLAPNGLCQERPDAFSFQHDVMWSERPAEHAVHRPDRWSHPLPGHSQALLLKKFLFKYMNKPYHVQFKDGCLNPQSFGGKILKLTFQLPGGWGEEVQSDIVWSVPSAKWNGFSRRN